MRLKFPDNFVIQIDNNLWIAENGTKSLVDNGGTLYPAGYFKSAEARQELGLVEVSEQPQPDPRYFYSSEDPQNPGSWISVPVPAEQLKVQLKDYAANKRWQVENGGIIVQGMNVPTDDIAQRKISELRRRVRDSEVPVPFNFKASNGWVSLNQAQIIALDKAVAAHVQVCYSQEYTVITMIDSGQITTYEQIDTAFGA